MSERTGRALAIPEARFGNRETIYQDNYEAIDDITKAQESVYFDINLYGDRSSRIYDEVEMKKTSSKELLVVKEENLDILEEENRQETYVLVIFKWNSSRIIEF